MQYQGTLYFEKFKTEFTNPTIDIDPVLGKTDPINMVITVFVWVSVEGVDNGAKHYAKLDNTPIKDLTYNVDNPKELELIVMDRLKYYEV